MLVIVARVFLDVSRLAKRDAGVLFKPVFGLYSSEVQRADLVVPSMAEDLVVLALQLPHLNGGRCSWLLLDSYLLHTRNACYP
eukprot:COSAG02_NODE_143_length_34133_cov_272.981282_4_plen_83_part_00